MFELSGDPSLVNYNGFYICLFDEPKGNYTPVLDKSFDLRVIESMIEGAGDGTYVVLGIRISWLIFSLACNHRLHFPNGKTGWRGLEQMRKDCGTREFIAHPSVYLERSLSANLSDVPLTADNTRMEFST